MTDAVVVSSFMRTVFQVRRTVLEMLHDRGYIVKVEDRSETEQEFARGFEPEKYQRSDNYIVVYTMRQAVSANDEDEANGTEDEAESEAKDEDEAESEASGTEGEGEGEAKDESEASGTEASPSFEKIIVFHHIEKFGVKHVRKYITYAEKMGIHTMIFVYAIPPSTHARMAIHDYNEYNSVRIEEFSEARVSFNVTKHDYVPPHTKLSETEKQALLSKYQCKERQLPRISSADPVARYYGLRPREVVRIVRKSETAGRCAHYRIVHPDILEIKHL